MARQLVLFILLLLFVLVPKGQNKLRPNDYKTIYNQAEQLYKSPKSNPKTDSVALLSYHKVIELLKGSNSDDNVLFDSYLKAAIIDMASQQNENSLKELAASINLVNHNKSLSDTLLFKSYLYSGSIYYSLFNFDSSLYYYRRAESIVESHPSVGETERLYNMLGVLYFETGDYKKSILYFEKALLITQSQKVPSPFFIVNYKNNIASAFRKLRRYQEALITYKSLLPYRSNTDELIYNIGSTYLDAGDARQAIQYLQKVQYKNLVKYNDLARAFIALEKYDSASLFLEKALATYHTSSKTKNNDFGIALKLQGDLLMEKHLSRQALEKYQQSIIQIDPDFTDTNVQHNPTSFYGLHNSFLLFDVLNAKAAAFAVRFRETNDRSNLVNAFSTYSAALSLARHVEKMYHSDEARLFLEQNATNTYKDAVKTSLQLYQLTKQQNYLAHAFIFAENSKASVLQTDLHELELDAIEGLPKYLIKEQNSLKASISKLNLEIGKTTDSSSLQKLQNSLRDQEFKLSQLQNKLDEDPKYSRLKFNEKQLSVDSIQQKLLTKDEALLSYYYYDDTLVCFYITRERFGYHLSQINRDLFQNIATLKRQLNSSSVADRKLMNTISANLYKDLIEPVFPNLQDKKRLLIIPYNELSYIPFEALIQSGSGEPLLYQFSCSYNYSANFLAASNNTLSNYNTLALAPFSTASSTAEFAPLPYSKEELTGLKGTILIDKEATKQRFIDLYNQYPVIHLATHAVLNDSIPLQSYVVFYTNKRGNETADRLYEQEIYHLDLQKAQLVILSACETGDGKLVNEEGVISLSRAFSYAGCKSVITSLWKADDAATAFITRKMHAYLSKGLAKDEALQKAKIDYLESDVDARFKTPAYWSHLILIGNNQPIASSNYLYYWLVALGIFVGIVALKRSRIQKFIYGQFLKKSIHRV